LPSDDCTRHRFVAGSTTVRWSAVNAFTVNKKTSVIEEKRVAILGSVGFMGVS